MTFSNGAMLACGSGGPEGRDTRELCHRGARQQAALRFVEDAQAPSTRPAARLIGYLPSSPNSHVSKSHVNSGVHHALTCVLTLWNYQQNTYSKECEGGQLRRCSSLLGCARGLLLFRAAVPPLAIRLRAFCPFGVRRRQHRQFGHLTVPRFQNQLAQLSLTRPFCRRRHSWWRASKSGPRLHCSRRRPV